MARVVQKFGGTSLASIAHIECAAERVERAVMAGDHVVVVTSAMAKRTNALTDLASGLGAVNNAEYDVALATGEQLSAALFALALQKRGMKSRSWMGWQLPIVTDDVYGNATVTHIDTARLEAFFEEKGVSVVAGFQGVTTKGRLTTIGRGGSDITATALAHYLGAKYCEICTDVPGVFTADPHRVPGALKIPQLDYVSMQRMASCGAQVLHPSALLYASKSNIPVHVRSSASEEIGTWISDAPASAVLTAAVLCQESWSCWHAQGMAQKGVEQKLLSLLPELSARGVWLKEGARAGNFFLTETDSKRHEAQLKELFKAQSFTSDIAYITLLKCVYGNDWSRYKKSKMCSFFSQLQGVLGVFETPDRFGGFVEAGRLEPTLNALHAYLYSSEGVGALA